MYGGLTKIRTRRRAAGSTNGTEPVRPVLGRLREPFPLSRGGATPYRFLLIRYTCVMVSGTHHQPALHSVVLSGNCPVVPMGCPAAP
ncbi:hypothetical protein EPH41_02310 [Neisseria gonorrhoeae]|nr:hypothetical protein EHJ43_00485 [Neisseria gonorrhoeae]TND21586.1 hypothetical protein EPH52_01375 [Neisseria gonorrhoeae]TND30323.1 hypothetical protein EPH48_03025 [Neisseria gonorrhoeae]TND36634.1 hypothetical protein EPH46_02255 [Neisseria gonorrhoeae]TND42977.1 hypothetical protein EPH42_01485 [Neisseria gonorrhoeae]